jgi:2-haloacid dehalogenase
MIKKNIAVDSNSFSSLSRRDFIAATVIGLAASQIPVTASASATKHSSKRKAILFDGFVIFNPKPVFDLAGQLYKDKSAELCALWRTKQFEYSWIRTSARQYENFWKVTEDALVFAAGKTGVNLTPESKDQLMNAYLNLDVWPDVPTGLKVLKEIGVSLSFLSNFTVEMIDSSLKRNKIDQYFDYKLSTDQVREFKPSPLAYQMGIDTLKLQKDEIVFAAFGAWDAAGAKLFGYPTYWVNRSNSPAEQLGVTANATGKTLNELITFVSE